MTGEKQNMTDLEKAFEGLMEDDVTEEEGDIEEEFENLFDIVEEEPEEELTDEELINDYDERLYELSKKQFESEYELDQELDRLLENIEQDFFWNPLKAVKKLVKKGIRGVKRLANHARKFSKKVFKKISPFKMFKKFLNPIKKLMKGNFKNLIKAAMSGLIPGGAAVMPAISALGFDAEVSDPEVNRENWRKVKEICKESYDYLLENMDEDVDDPVEASRLANEAFGYGLNEVKNKYYRANRSRFINTGRRKQIAAGKGDILELKIV